MTDHAIPPRELVEQWASEKCYDERDWLYELHIANRAAQWGADHELEACCALLELSDDNARDFLYSARRPKPPSLKEQALEALDRMDQFPTADDKHTIRRALEQLDD
jgi:hypothetical protein